MRRWCHIFAVFAAALASTARAQETNLPPVATLLEKVMERAKQEHTNDRHFRTRYAYVRTRTTRELDAKGRVKKEQTKQSRNNPAPLPTSQAAPALIPVASVTQTNNPERKGFDKNDFILNPDLLNRFDFTLVKREELNGRPAYLLNFKPANKKLPSHGIKDRFINKAAGAVWIDEEDLVLSKADLYLTDSINVVGGLVGAIKQFNYVLVRTRTPDGLWYANDIHWRLEGREIFSKKLMEYEESRSEVKKVR